MCFKYLIAANLLDVRQINVIIDHQIFCCMFGATAFNNELILTVDEGGAMYLGLDILMSKFTT